MPVKSVNQSDSLIKLRTEEDRTQVLNLVNVLETEIQLYQDLLEMLHKQRKCFSSGDIAGFEEINKQLGTVVLKIKTLEEARKAIVQQFAKRLNISQDEPTISKLAEFVGEPYDVKLLQLRKKINFMVKELNSVKEGNAYFIQHALRYVSGVLKIFAFDSEDHRYQRNGKLENNIPKGRMISSWG